MVTVGVRRGNGSKSVEDYGENGPPNLREIEATIEGIVRRTKWKKH
jgi:hypothetical protein